MRKIILITLLLIFCYNVGYCENKPPSSIKNELGIVSTYKEFKQDITDFQSSAKKSMYALIYTTLMGIAFISISYIFPYKTGILLRWSTYCIMFSKFLELIT